MDGSMDRQMDGRTDGQKGRMMHRSMASQNKDRPMFGQMDRQTFSSKDRQTDRPMDKGTDRNKCFLQCFATKNII